MSSALRSYLLPAVAAMLASVSVCLSPCHASDGTEEEYQVKAERICSFTRFIDWPSRKFSGAGSPFVIGVFGTDAITAMLREAIQGRQIKEREVVIRHMTAREELRGCHVLFVSRSERDRLGPILAEVRREGVLTVGETENFIAKGGIINLVPVAGTIRFQINGEAAKRERLTVSAKLLQIALPRNFDPANPLSPTRFFSGTVVD